MGNFLESIVSYAPSWTIPKTFFNHMILPLHFQRQTAASIEIYLTSFLTTTFFSTNYLSFVTIIHMDIKNN
jgi:hypothetical protein